MKNLKVKIIIAAIVIASVLMYSFLPSIILLSGMYLGYTLKEADNAK